MHYWRVLMTLVALLTLISTLSALPTDFNCINNNDFETRLVFRTPSYDLTDVEGMQKIKLSDSYPEDWAGIPGTPELPVFSTLVNIPAGVRVNISYTVRDEEVIENTYLLPNRDLDDVRDQILTYTIDPDTYYQSERDLIESAELGDAGIMRNTVLQRVIVHPFRYDAHEEKLFVAREIEIELSYVSDSRGLSPRRTTASSPIFQSMAREMTANPAQATDRSEQMPGSYLFIYDGSAEVLSTIQGFIQWKHAKGHEVNLLDTSTIGNNTIAIGDYIQNAYDTWDNPPEFICILGDANSSFTIPTFWEEYGTHSVHGDHPYTLLDGDDLFPEVLIGRLSFNSITQLQTIISKIMKYEIEPITDDNWIERILLVGDYYSSGISTNTTMLYVEEMMMGYNPAYDVTFINSDPFVMQISNALNNGVGAYFYRGFGNFSNWVNSDSYNLFNYNMNPFMTAITCYTGTFGSGTECVIESFLRAGTPANPTGVTAVIGSSSPTHTCFNNLITGTIAYGIYHEGMTNLSAALNLGKLALYNSYPDNPNDYVDWYTIGKNLLGDPGMTLRTAAPQAFTVDQQMTIEVGSTTHVVTVSDAQGNPVEGAVVTLIQTDGEIDSRAMTGNDGVAVLYFDPAVAGTAQLVVTKYNFLPSITNPEVAEGAVVDYTTIDFTADAVTGETAQFNVMLHNYSSTSITGVTATVTCDDNQIDITSATVNYGTIAAGQDADGDSDFTVSVSPECLDGNIFDLELAISSDSGDWITYIPLTISGPMLEVSNVMTDPVTALPGATVEMYLTLTNTGSQAFEAVTCQIASVSQLVTISDDNGTFGDIEPNEATDNASSPYSVTIGEDAITGTIIPFTAIATNSDGITQALEFDLHIGNPSVTDPTGPDNYGYYCYDDGDTQYDDCPVYDWIEIDPNYGGNGTSLEMNDHSENGSGNMITIDLPFNFRFYEINYNQLSISSNGYIVLGPYYTFEWMNWPIPGPFVPCPLIAPFWDDLLTTDGNVYYWYDQQNHAFIVQWSRLENRYDGSPETFQAILYDPAYNSTLLGDSKIKFQYMEINNVDMGNYYNAEIDHGEYATVGIADHTTHNGIEYTYSNSYSITAKELEDEMAILFTGPNVPVPYAHPYVSDIDMTDLGGNTNGLIDFGETVQIALAMSNLGLATATDVYAIITTTDPNADIQQGTITFPDIENGESASSNQSFILDIADNCPNDHTVNLTLMLYYSGMTKQLLIPFVVYSPELEIVDFSITDNNDNQIEAGEVGTFTFTMARNSYLNAEDVTVSFETENAAFTISPSSYSFSEITDEEVEVAFNVSFADTTYNGERVDFNLHLEYNDAFDIDQPVSYVFGHPELLFSDSFDGDYDPFVWMQMQGAYSETNFAGGETGEYVLTSISYDARTAITREFSPMDLQKLIIKAKYINLGYNVEYGILIEQNSAPFSSAFIWTDHAIMNEPGELYIEYTPDIAFDDDVILIFYIFNTPGGHTQQFYFDDVEIRTIKHNPGVLQGMVTLDGGNATPDEVTMLVGSNEYSVNEDGTFCHYLPEGTYTISATLNGYIPFYTSNVVVTHSQTTQVNIELQHLTAPTNLEGEQDGDVINLTWDYNGTRTRSESKGRKSGDSRTLDYFDVIMVYNNNFVLHHETDELSYPLDLLAPGHFEIYVKARHLGGYWSEESNHIELDYVANDNDVPDAPECFALHQNHPNPFNPTTSIRFDLPQASSKCLLAIYNVRGERVATLVDGPRKAGRYTEQWNGRNQRGEAVSSGVYFIRIETDTDKSIRKALLLK